MWTEKSRHERGKRMLKGIPKILSPELLKVLCEMGHSDRLVIADGNFPAESMGKDAIVIAKHDSRGGRAIGQIERFAFYEEAKKVYAIIATGESALYANIMLQKGVVTE